MGQRFTQFIRPAVRSSFGITSLGRIVSLPDEVLVTKMGVELREQPRGRVSAGDLFIVPRFPFL